MSDTRGDLMDLIALCSSYNRLDEYTYAHLCPAPSLPPSLLPSSSPLSMSSLVSPCLSRVRSSASVPLASIGILTDIQCADVENGWNFLKTEQRYYRHALTATRRAIQALHRSSTPVRFVIHLGDLIDGLNAGLDNEHRASERMLTEAMKILPQPSRNRIIPLAADTHHDAPMQSYSLIGNHELMNFPRSRWANVLGLGKLSEESRAAAATAKQQSSSSSIPSSPARTYRFTYDHSHEHHHPAVATEEANESSKSTSAVSSSSSTAPYTSLSPLYYDLDIGGAYRLLMIDTYEISVLGYTDILPQPTPSQLATTFLELENPNENKNSPLNLEGREKRKVAFNGGLSSRQMEWIRDVLTDCRRLGQSALICSHVTIHHDACHPSALVWNQDELLDLIHRFKDVVIGCLSGHDHDGGHFVDQDGQHTRHTHTRTWHTQGITEMKEGRNVYRSFLFTLVCSLFIPPPFLSPSLCSFCRHHPSHVRGYSDCGRRSRCLWSYGLLRRWYRYCWNG